MALEGGGPEDTIIACTQRQIGEMGLFPGCRAQVRHVGIGGGKEEFDTERPFIALIIPADADAKRHAERALAGNNFFEPLRPYHPAPFGARDNSGFTFHQDVAFVIQNKHF